MNKKINAICHYLDEIYPSVSCELIYRHDYELVIAVMLSAQTTDVSVNRVTAVLFNKYPSLISLFEAPIEDIERLVSPLGLYKKKASNIKQIALLLHNNFSNKVPIEKEQLMSLPGVGNKSAGVIRAELFNIPELPVDTHILRIAKRLSLANDQDDATKAETKIKKLIDQDRWIKSHHQLIHFGRYFCTARKPKCSQCKIKDICRYAKYN